MEQIGTEEDYVGGKDDLLRLVRELSPSSGTAIFPCRSSRETR